MQSLLGLIYADGGEYVTDIKVTDTAAKVYGLTDESTFEEFDSVIGQYVEVYAVVEGREDHQFTEMHFDFERVDEVLTLDPDN